MDYEPHHHPSMMMMDSVQKMNPVYGQYSQQQQQQQSQLLQQPKKSLGLLAEVAITRLIEEQKNEAALSSSSKTKIINRIYSLKQIRKLSEKKLLMTFAERLKSAIDKNHKLFSYKCQILPAECQMKYEYRGVGADDEAVVKNRMVDHLLGHLCNLEKSLPNIKISSSRKVKSRNRTAKKVIGGPAKATTSSRVTARKGSSSSGGSRTTKVKVESPTTTITIQQQSVITSSAAGATPLDMSTTAASGSSSAAVTGSASGPMSSPYSEDKKMLVLKFFEEDHSYTMSASAQPQPQTQFPSPSPQSTTTSTTSPSQSQQIQLPTSVVDHHYHHHQQEGSTRLLNEALTTSSTTSMEHYHPSVITPNISQTVEIRTSVPQQQQQMMVPVSSIEPGQTASTTPGSNIRALALDYIDDIRKKSSSAAKSIIVNGDKSLIYQCKICPDKQFTSTNGLIFHYKKHAGLKPYVCELCSATFTRQHSLNYHMLIHLNKSRFVCSECGRHFRHPSHFKEHMRRHTGETPFQCADCLIRFKTRNTYKRHLQTKHAKILTSKGIIELSNAVPYQSAPRAGSAGNTNTTSSVSGGLVSGTSTTTGVLLGSTGVGSVMAGSTVQLGPIGPLGAPGSPVSGGAAGGVSIKPRRKYGIRFLHKNIEAMSKYDQQGPTAGAIEQQLPTVPLDYSQHHHHLATSQSGITIQGHQVATSPSGQNITILSIPSHAMHAGMNTVHILDNTGANGARLGKPLVDLTDNVNYSSHHGQPGQAITLVSYQPAAVNSSQQQQSTVVSSVPSAIEPIQPVLSSPTSIPISTGHLTELTSSPAMMTFSTLTPAAGSAGAGALGQQVHEQQQPQPQNENFMRLLEAIALTENP